MPIVDVPGLGPVDASGFAEEQTMQRILAALQNMNEGASGTGGVMSLDAISARAAQNVRELGAQSRSAGVSAVQNANGINSASDAMQNAQMKYSRALSSAGEFATKASKGPLDAVVAVADKVKDVVDGVSGALMSSGSVISSGIGVALRGATETLALTLGTLAGDMNKMGKSFRDAQAAGGLFGGSMIAYRNVVGAAGLTMEQYNGILQKSGEDVSKFAGGTLTGAQEFARQNSNLIRTQGQDLLRLGLNFEDMGSRTAEFLASLTESGQSIDMYAYNQDALSVAIRQQVVQQKALASINGTTLEQEREKMRQQRKDAQLNAVMMGMSDDQRKVVQQLSAQFPQATQFIKEFVAFGGAVSKEGLMQQTMMGATTDAIGNALTSIENGADPQATMKALEAMSKNSEAISSETAAMADLVKLGVAGATNSFVKMAEQNFQAQFELMNKANAGVIDNTLGELNTSMTNFSQGADRFTAAMGAIDSNFQRVSTGLGNLANSIYGTDGFSAALGSASDGVKMLGSAINLATTTGQGIGALAPTGTGAVQNRIPGSFNDTRPGITSENALPGGVDSPGMIDYTAEKLESLLGATSEGMSALIESMGKVTEQSAKTTAAVEQNTQTTKETNTLISKSIQDSNRNAANTNRTVANNS